MARLVALALRRALPPWFLVGLVALLALAARASAGAPLVAPAEPEAAALRALARQNVWSVLLALAPLQLYLAARLGVGGARAWLAPTPARAATLSFALAAGAGLAALATALVAALAGELATDAGPRAWRRAALLDCPRTVLRDEAASVRWSVPAPAPGERLRLWVTVALGAGPTATARFTAHAGERAVAVETRAAGRTLLELDAPSGGGALELELERVGAGALLVLGPEALELLAPAPSERLDGLWLGARVALALGAGGVLALALASVLRPALAAALVLALGLAAGSLPLARAWVPGADLPQVWAALERGLVPEPAPLRAFAGALLVAALGVCLHARAFRRPEDAR